MLTTLMTAYAVFLVAVLSPGPDFAITVQNSVRHGRRAGVFTAFGIAGGNLVHIAYVNVGLGALIAHSIVAFNVMKIVAAVYLCWIGWKALRSKPYDRDAVAGDAPRAAMTDAAALRLGAFTCLLNPKAALFWLSFFTLVLKPGMPLPVFAGFIAALVLSIAAWFGVVAWFISQDRVRRGFLKCGHWFDRATGAVLIGLGLQVAFARR